MARISGRERKINTHIYMPVSLLDAVDAKADELATTRSAIIVEALEEWLKRHEEQQ